jgi:hypothetical protein
MATTRKRKRNLGATPSRSKSLSFKKMGNDLKGPGTILAGIIGGAMIDKFLLSKVAFLQPKEGSKMSNFIKPAAILALGLAGRQLAPGGPMVKDAMDGVAIYGAIKGVNAATGKDVMTGLGARVAYKEYHRLPAQKQEYAIEPMNQTPVSI